MSVDRWKIYFTGDSPKEAGELQLFDFLEQVEMFRRAEKMPESDLMDKIVHLLRGRARAWYQLVYRNLHSWDECVECVENAIFTAELLI